MFPTSLPIAQPQEPPLRLALSVPETAKALGIGRTLCFRLIRDGEIPVVKIHGRTVVPITEIETFLARGAK